MARLSSGSSDGSVTLSLRALALAAVFVSLASLTTLIIVVRVQNIDALNTVAIALAILAFVVQLQVFIVQSADAARSARDGQSLHTQLVAVLTQIQERTQGTQRSVEQMNTQLLEAVLNKAAGEGLSAESPEFTDRVVSVIEASTSDVAEPAATSSTEAESRNAAPSVSRSPASDRPDSQSRNTFRPSSGDSDTFPPPLHPDEAARLNREIRSWPPQASGVEQLRDEFLALDDDTLVDLYRLSRDLAQFTRPGASFAPGLSLWRSEKMVGLGLAEKVPGWRLYVLSKHGRELGRFFMAEGTPPEGLRSAIEKAADIRRSHEQAGERARSNRD